MNSPIRKTPRALAAGAAMLFLCAAAKAETIEIVVAGDIVGWPSIYPNMHNANSYIFEHGIYSEVAAGAIFWPDMPEQVGDEMRVLLTFDAATWSPGPPSWCGSPTRLYPVTGSATIGDVAAVIDPGAQFEVFECNGFDWFYLSADASGPSLYSAPWSESGSLAWLYPSVEMPMKTLIVALPSATGANCIDENGDIPATTAGFRASCGAFNTRYMSLWWESGTFCYVGDPVNCHLRAYHQFWIENAAGSAFAIRDPSTEDYVDQLIAEVLVLNLDQGIQNSLDAKIAEAVGASDQVALAAYATTTTQKQTAKSSARNRLGAFINAVNAQRGKAIPDEKATRLVQLAERLAARL